MLFDDIAKHDFAAFARHLSTSFCQLQKPRDLMCMSLGGLRCQLAAWRVLFCFCPFALFRLTSFLFIWIWFGFVVLSSALFYFALFACCLFSFFTSEWQSNLPLDFLLANPPRKCLTPTRLFDLESVRAFVFNIHTTWQRQHGHC